MRHKYIGIMIAVNLILIMVTALTVSSSDGVGDSYFPTLGNDGYDVQHYTITLDVDVEANKIDGWTEITFITTDDLPRFNLDFGYISVQEVTLDGVSAEGEFRQGEFIITPETPLPADTEHTLRIAYSGTPGGSWIDYEGGVMVFGEPDGASGWYPVNEHPSDKATYILDITVDAPYVVASNGIGTTETLPDGRLRYRFEPQHTMASYLVTVSIGDFNRVEDESASGVPIRNYFAASLDENIIAEFDRTPEMIDIFSEAFGPYPFEVYGVVVHDVTLSAALETQTLSTFGTTLAVERVAAHELAHQWFGNSVSLTDWSDIWLNEGFATYAEFLWLEHAEGKDAADDAIRAAYHANVGEASRFTPRRLSSTLSRFPYGNETIPATTAEEALSALLEGTVDPTGIGALTAQIDVEGIYPLDLTALITQADFVSEPVRPSRMYSFLDILGYADDLDPMTLPVLPGDPGPERLFSRVVYTRGGLTLHALRLEMGDEAFFELLRAYAETYRNGNATTEDFIALAKAISGEDLTAFFDAWLYGFEIPDIPQMGLYWEDFS